MRGRDPVSGKFVRLPEPSSLTAAVSTIPTTAIDRLPRSAEDWQMRAFRLWRILGILHQPTSQKAKQVGRLGWNVTQDGRELTPEQSEDAMAAVCAPLTVSEAARRIALNIELVGQVFYARISDGWNVLSPTTPKLKELLKRADIVIEGLTPDPEDPTKPDSSVRAALGTAEQIRLMSALSRSQDRNRLAQRGILLKPKEGQFPEGDPFQANLEEAMTAPINDEYAPSAVVPLVVTFPGDLIEKWRHLLIESPYDDNLMEKIEASVRQFALELDMPPELLLGNMDSNHWNAWLSSEENYRGHVEPLGQQTGDVFARAMMEAVSGVSVIEIEPDPSELLARRSSVEDAFAGARLGAVGLEYVRRQMGADGDDAPTPEDVELVLRLQGKAADPAASVSPEPKRAAPQTPERNGKPVVAALTPREKELDRLGRQLMHIDVQLLGTLKGAATMAVESAREKDGPEVGQAERIEREMTRLGRAWKRTLADARRSLAALGIDTSGHTWDEAQELSVDELTRGMTDFIVRTIDLTDAAMPAIPTDLLRSVIATAGGSRTAVVQ